MTRTSTRPLPSGAITTQTAIVFSLALGIASVVLLTWAANFLTAMLGLSAIVLYVGVYTPLNSKVPSPFPLGRYPGRFLR